MQKKSIQMVVAGKTVTVQIGKEMHKIVLADCIRNETDCGALINCSINCKIYHFVVRLFLFQSKYRGKRKKR